MFQFSWFHFLTLAIPFAGLLLIYGLRRLRSPGQMQAVATQLDGKARSLRRIEGMTRGLRWELTLELASYSLPFWRVTFPDVSCTDFAVRASTGIDTFWKTRGLIGALSEGDEKVDARHLILCAQPAAAGALLRHEPAREALRALHLVRAPLPAGGILWVQAGRELEAALDVSQVRQEARAQRVAELIHSLMALAQALREAPQRGEPGAWHQRWFDGRAVRSAVIAFLLVWVVGNNLTEFLRIRTGYLEESQGLVNQVLLRSALLGLGVAAMLGLAYAWQLRRSPLLLRRAPFILVLMVGGMLLGSSGMLGLNALSAVPEEPRQAKVRFSRAPDSGFINGWQFQLEELGRFNMTAEAGRGVKAGDTVRVQLATGALGAKRVLSWSLVQRAPP